jgi:hypothetical protein
MGSAQNPDTKQWEPALQKTISLSPAATPSGRIELGVINLAAAAIFVPGKEYYVDITPLT